MLSNGVLLNAADGKSRIDDQVESDARLNKVEVEEAPLIDNALLAI